MTLINADQLDTSPVEWLVESVIPRSGIGIMWGPSTAGKSLVGFDLALSVGNRVPFMGHQVQHQGAVAYCLGEGLTGAGIRLKARQAREQADQTAAIAAMARDHGDAAARAMSAALPPYDARNVHILTEGFSCHFDRSEKPAASMARALAQLATIPDLELVLLDALADFKGQLSLANDSSAGRIIQGMKFLASELNTTVLAIAHPVADGHKMAGSARLFQASDFVIEITPDEVAADGRKSATLSSRKSKEDEGFPPAAYVIEPCQWSDPEEDPETGELTGGTVLVKSATIRLLSPQGPGAAPSPEPQRPPAPLPVLQDVPRRTKRNGIRQDRAGLHSVPDLPAAVPVPADATARREETSRLMDARVTAPGGQPLATMAADADARREVVRAVLGAGQCAECSRPAQMSCDARMGGAVLLLGRTLSGPMYAHEDRVLAACLAGAVDLDQVMAMLAAA